jgi:DNA-binding transcriptional LysR family regulator
MDLKQLRTFIRVAEAGSLSRASDRMRLAQPALSRQIKMLEAEIGTPLFDRHARGMELTEAGRELVTRVSGLVRQLEQCIDDIRSMPSVVRGQVSLGLMPTVSRILAGRIAERVSKELPEVFLRIVESYDGHLVEWLQRGEIDATLLYGPSSDLHLRTEELLYEDLVLVGPKDSGLSPDNVIKLADAATLKLALPSKSHGLRSVLELAAAKSKVTLNVAFEGDAFSVLRDLVIRGLCHTILPRSALKVEEEAGLLRVARIKPALTRQLILALPSNRSDTHATRAVVDLVVQEMAQMVRSGEWQAYPGSALRDKSGPPPATG